MSNIKVVSPSIYLNGLNGIRAIAACAVLVFHINHSLPLFGFKKGADLHLAGFGVTMFFALSGFLITYLLLIEKQNSTQINIRNFYLRRVLRIWPLYFTIIIVTTVSVYIFTNADTHRLWTLFYYVFFLPNIPFIINYGINHLGHLWSIGIEEQFYIFWPILIKKRGKLLKNIFFLHSCNNCFAICLTICGN